jgi:hypothetical protein
MQRGYYVIKSLYYVCCGNNQLSLFALLINNISPFENIYTNLRDNIYFFPFENIYTNLRDHI